MRTALLFFVFLLGSASLGAQPSSRERCSDVILLDGSERIVKYDLDSTKNWWALTSPYDSLYRLHVNGFSTGTYQILYAPRFSYDGEHWATFAMRNNVWYFLYDTTVKQLPCTDVGALFFTPNSQQVVYSYFEGLQEVIVKGQTLYRLNSPRIGSLYCTQNGERIAFVTGQSGSKALILNGTLGQSYDDIQPFGFWADGQFMYAARSGQQWRIYRGEEEIGSAYQRVFEPMMNLAGTVAAFIATQGELSTVVMIADEYVRPVVSRQYARIDNLALHPNLPLYAARAYLQNNYLMVFSGAEYSAGQQGNGKPWFTHDGSELVYFGCDNDCFIVINGKLTPLNSVMNPEGSYAHKPKASTFAFSTSTSLVYRKIEKNDLWVSKMCDEISPPRYNWRTDKYEALGRISQRLYLISCNYQ